jgi:hypothetical protein
MRQTINGIAALGGVLYTILALGGLLLIGDTLPEASLPPAELARHLADHPPTTLTWAGISLELAGLLMLLLFCARLALFLDRSWAGAAALACGAGAVVVKLAGAGPVLAVLAFPDGLGPEILAGLLRINDGAVPVFDALMVPFGLLTGWLIWETARLPRWLGIFGAAAAVLNVASNFLPGFAALPWALWPAMASIFLFLRTRSLELQPTGPMGTALP